MHGSCSWPIYLMTFKITIILVDFSSFEDRTSKTSTWHLVVVSNTSTVCGSDPLPPSFRPT